MNDAEDRTLVEEIHKFAEEVNLSIDRLLKNKFVSRVTKEEQDERDRQYKEENYCERERGDMEEHGTQYSSNGKA